MVYETFAISGVTLLVSGAAIIVSTAAAYRLLINPVERSFKEHLTTLDGLVEQWINQGFSEDRIMNEVHVLAISDATIGLNTGQSRPLGEVYAEIRDGQHKWSGFSFWEKFNRAKQAPYMPMPGAGIQITK